MQGFAEDAVLGQHGRGIPNGVAERRQQIGLDQISGGLRRHAGGEQQDHPAGDREQPPGRDPQQPEIERRPDRDAAGQPDDPTGEQGARAETAARGDAVKEQHRLRALAQHGKPHYHRQHIERPRAGDHRVADFPGGRGQFAAVTRHPDVVPAEHADREEQDHRVQQLLADAGGSCGDLGGEQSDDTGADDASRQSGRDPEPAAPRADTGGQDDADDQRRLQHLTKHDDGCSEHRDRPPPISR